MTMHQLIVQNTPWNGLKIKVLKLWNDQQYLRIWISSKIYGIISTKNWENWNQLMSHNWDKWYKIYGVVWHVCNVRSWPIQCLAVLINALKAVVEHFVNIEGISGKNCIEYPRRFYNFDQRKSLDFFRNSIVLYFHEIIKFSYYILKEHIGTYIGWSKSSRNDLRFLQENGVEEALFYT